MLAIIEQIELGYPRGNPQYKIEIQDIHRTQIIFSLATSLVQYLIDYSNEEQYYSTNTTDIVVWYRMVDYELRTQTVKEAFEIAKLLDKGSIPTVSILEEMREGVAEPPSENVIVLRNNHDEPYEDYGFSD